MARSAMPAGTQTVRAPLRTILPQTRDTRTLRLDAALVYRPGQAIAVEIPGDVKKRYFSLSSSPTEAGYIEITVKADPDSELSRAIAGLKRGAVIPVEGPLGSFGLPDDVRTPLCFIAAGSGVAPFRSMIKFLLDSSAGQDLWLLHSVKGPEDLIFRAEFEEWSGEDKRFRYVPTITRDFDDNWVHETGRISETLLRKHIPEGPCVFLLCGPPDFVSDIESLLHGKLNIPTEHIRREQW